jgi:hypothetical protein
VLSTQHCMAARPRQASRRRLAGPPNPNAANAIAVTDGTEFAGSVVESDHVHFAFGPDGVLIGKFPTRAAAVAALPKVSA